MALSKTFNLRLPQRDHLCSLRLLQMSGTIPSTVEEMPHCVLFYSVFNFYSYFYSMIWSGSLALLLDSPQNDWRQCQRRKRTVAKPKTIMGNFARFQQSALWITFSRWLTPSRFNWASFLPSDCTVLPPPVIPTHYSWMLSPWRAIMLHKVTFTSQQQHRCSHLFHTLYNTHNAMRN